ncbi:MAG: T9SS type A sorting domain-containing protein, partial [Candidatus Latescibacterota bacterium]
PFTVPTDIPRNLSVFVHPENDSTISGDMVIESNDPQHDSFPVPIRTDIRMLNMRTRKITGPGGATLGDPLTIVVTPTPLDTRIESGTLHYGIPRLSGDVFALPLFASESDDFVGIIPGEHVTEAGLEWYVEVRNLPVRTYYPPTAPEIGDTVVPWPPTTVSAIAQPNSEGGYLEGREILVLVDTEQGTVLDSARVHYRLGGEDEDAYEIAIADVDAAIPSATIPDSLTGPRGVEYWLEAFTLSHQRLTDPAEDPATNPSVLQIDIPNLDEPRSFEGGVYRMVTIPLDFGDFGGTLAALLSDQKPFSPHEIEQWRAFRWVRSEISGKADYVELLPRHEAHFRPVPGRAFWLISSERNRITTAPITGRSTTTDGPYNIDLEPGWNQIGNPFNFEVAWDSITVVTEDTTLAMADAEGSVVEEPVRWTSTDYRRGVVTMKPFEGYWVKNVTETQQTVTLLVPPREAVGQPVLSSEPDLVTEETDDGWRVQIAASSASARDVQNYIGVATDARREWDRYDRSEPPMCPGVGVGLCFPHASWELRPGLYSSDIQGNSRGLDTPQEDEGAGYMWRFDVAKNFSLGNAGDAVTLTFSGLGELPSEYQAVLVDRALDRTANLKVVDRYEFYLGRKPVVRDETRARFIVLVGDHEFIEEHRSELLAPPTKTVLFQNYPNPFNPRTIIRYELAKPGRVSLRVYDVTGALVRVLEERDRPPGRYEIGWDGESENGGRVASGVYFYQLKAPGFSQTRKMVLVE